MDVISDRKTDRNQYFDLVKGIAIILVVFGHCIQYGSGDPYLSGEYFFDNIVFKAIYSFHMPLFAIVSGYLFYYSISRRSAGECIKKQIFGLVIPIVVWSVAKSLGEYGIKAVLLRRPIEIAWAVDIIKTCITELWFLWAMFWCSLAVVLIKKFFKDRIAIYILVAICLLWFPNILGASKCIFMYPYYIGGYLCHKFSVIEKISAKGKASLGILAGAVWCVMLCFYEKSHYIYITGTCLWGNNIAQQMGIDVFRWTIGAAGSIAVLYAASLITSYQNRLISLCAMLGTKTMGIYIISNYANVFVLKQLTKGIGFSWLAIILETVIMLAFTVAVSWVLGRNKITRQVFLGGRMS